MGAAVYAVGQRKGLPAYHYPAEVTNPSDYLTVSSYLYAQTGVMVWLVLPDILPGRQPGAISLDERELGRWITYLNDEMLWSRERIADWLASPDTIAAYDAAVAASM